MGITKKLIYFAAAKKAFNWIRGSSRKSRTPNRATGASRAPGRVGR